MRTIVPFVGTFASTWNIWASRIDPEKNKFRGRQMDISIDYARVRVLVIPTNEELVIAEDTERLVNEAK